MQVCVKYFDCIKRLTALAIGSIKRLTAFVIGLMKRLIVLANDLFSALQFNTI